MNKNNVYALVSTLFFNPRPVGNFIVTMVTGDPATLLVSLCHGLKSYCCSREWNEMLKERDLEKEKANRYEVQVFSGLVDAVNKLEIPMPTKLWIALNSLSVMELFCGINCPQTNAKLLKEKTEVDHSWK